MTMTIKFADDAASNAWELAGLGDFDPNSNLADEIDADDDGVITEAEIETYNKNKNEDPKLPDYEIDPTTYYSAVDISEAPQDYSGMKDVLNKCIESFDGIVKFITDLINKSNDLKTEIDTLNIEISAISTDDGTGSGQNSVYSLTTAAERSSASGNTTGGSNDGTTTASSDEVPDQLTEKTNRANELIKVASDNSANLTQASTDLGVTDNSVAKIMEAVGESKKNNDSFWEKYKNATNKTLKDFQENPLKLLIGGYYFFSNLFEKDEGEKVIDLGHEAEKHSQTAKDNISNADAPVNDAYSASNKLQTILNSKKTATNKK